MGRRGEEGLPKCTLLSWGREGRGGVGRRGYRGAHSSHGEGRGGEGWEERGGEATQVHTPLMGKRGEGRGGEGRRGGATKAHTSAVILPGKHCLPKCYPMSEIRFCSMHMSEVCIY